MIKLLLIVAAVLTVTACKAAPEEEIQPSKNILRSGTIALKRIEKKFNHFNYSDTRTINAIYVINTENYKSDGPLFVYINDNFPYGNILIPRRDIFNKLVKEHCGAALVYYNRYVEYSVEKLKDIQYFTVEQHLADLSYLIRTFRKMYKGMEKAKVIIGGGHMAGSLAVWFKKLYPDLVNGVWAFGAPLLAKADFSEYYKVLGNAIKELGGDACYNRIQYGFARLELMLANNRTAEVTQMFNLCPSFDGSNDLDVSAFFSEIFLTFDFYTRRDIYTISKICDILIKQPSDVRAIAQNFVKTFRKPCIDSSYRSYLDRMKGNNELAMIFLQCNQFGWFRTSSSLNQPFGSKCPLSFFTAVCKDLFGDKYTVNNMENNIREFNDNHGGSDLNLENVYFTYGDLNPWRAVGIHDDNMVTIIPSCGQDCNLYATGFDLPPALDEVHKKLSALVTEWLKQ